VLVAGVRFDALQVGVRMLWENKTHQFDTYPAFIQEREIEKEIPACAWSGGSPMAGAPSHCRSAMRGSQKRRRTGNSLSCAMGTRATP
jgi:hypothetical protein